MSSLWLIGQKTNINLTEKLRSTLRHTRTNMDAITATWRFLKTSAEPQADCLRVTLHRCKNSRKKRSRLLSNRWDFLISESQPDGWMSCSCVWWLLTPAAVHTSEASSKLTKGLRITALSGLQWSLLFERLFFFFYHMFSFHLISHWFVFIQDACEQPDSLSRTFVAQCPSGGCPSLTAGRLQCVGHGISSVYIVLCTFFFF